MKDSQGELAIETPQQRSSSQPGFSWRGFSTGTVTKDHRPIEMKAKDDLQREIQTQSCKYALRYIATLVASAACCAGVVSWVIWLTQ